jgi:hypothetical protein
MVRNPTLHLSEGLGVIFFSWSDPGKGAGGSSLRDVTNGCRSLRLADVIFGLASSPVHLGLAGTVGSKLHLQTTSPESLKA